MGRRLPGECERTGAVRVYDCRMCGRIGQLTAIARARLHQIVRAKR